MEPNEGLPPVSLEQLDDHLQKILEAQRQRIKLFLEKSEIQSMVSTALNGLLHNEGEHFLREIVAGLRTEINIDTISEKITETLVQQIINNYSEGRWTSANEKVIDRAAKIVADAIVENSFDELIHGVLEKAERVVVGLTHEPLIQETAHHMLTYVSTIDDLRVRVRQLEQEIRSR